tara:strand:+ start:3102 stop:3314 length:213 start_codon:yes stop_codon:yes gene_type:complete
MDKKLKTKMSDLVHGDMDSVNEVIYLIKDTIANDSAWTDHAVGKQAEKVIVELRRLRKELAEVHKEICGE